jgi:hypothetical protein
LKYKISISNIKGCLNSPFVFYIIWGINIDREEVDAAGILQQFLLL